ncbi:glucosaminidase domain-containing protein [Companilactobacillus keshanensis]|uniref:Peptidoglycan hydrolase n=1 Tax=Companilactobacillus keshanensis TaxID=2486003 RepID=A0ABW4BTT0_9LACO|nr:glucosaminidase domain-containing protein [Companilactobacillus keshanensis]
MTITRRQRMAEESRLTKLNNKKAKRTNLKKKMTVLGAGLFVGGTVAEVSNATLPIVHADSYSNNDSTDDTQASTDSSPIITPRGVGDQEFIDYIGNSARKLAQNNDIYASVMIAQAMVESGWGTSGLASAPNYNLFGIKGSYKGDSVNMGTQEDDGTGSLYSISSDFKKYPSYKESLEDYVYLIRGGVSGDPQIYSGAWKSNTSSYKDATSYLTGLYATDTSYADKLNSVIEKYNLTQFDQADDSVQDQSYVVAQGDTLQSVATKFNMDVNSLKTLNNINSDSYVYPGKTLNVTSQAQPQDTTDAINVTNTLDDTTKDAYGANQAPIIVKDETNGVKKHTKSISVDNTISDNSASSSSDQSSSVTVQSGDTIDSIASQAGTTVDKVRQDNNLNSDLLVVGQKLMV